ncbi:MAG TPA: hypothetical protein VFK69_03515, partial [Candidatus Eisenbacteria bacterium]|nr:hypothetical protein [Candidatus Eisenbacteria bacterium]
AVARGDTLHRDPPLVALWPPRADADEPGWSARQSLTSPDNAAGVVLEAGAGGARALLLADVDSLIELRIAPALPIVVLKVGHHGSGSSSGARFLVRCDPALAVISVGARNRFGHPAPGVLARLSLTRARLLRTDRDGAVWLEGSDDGVRMLDWRDGVPRAPPIVVARRAPQP